MSPPYKNGNGSGSFGAQAVPWVAVVIALGSGFWAVANPRDDIKAERTDRMENIRQMKQDLETEMRQNLTKSQYGEFVVRSDREIQRLQDLTKEIQKGLVSREEHVQHWHEIDDKHNALRQQVYELRNQFTSTYNIGDQLKSLQKQIDDLRRVPLSAAPPT